MLTPSFFEGLKTRKTEGRNCYYNTKVKVYPDGRYLVTYCTKKIYSYDEDRNGIITETPLYGRASSDRPDNSYKNIRRAKERAFDIIFMNDWSNWCTFTFDPRLVDSRDKEAVMKVLLTWLNKRKTFDGLQYFLIPEYHPRSKDRIHVHCLTNDVLPLSDSGCVKVDGIKKPMRIATADLMGFPEDARHPIYNVDNWHYGFSTCEKLYGSVEKIASYLQKYMTKDVKRIFGKLYWSSHGLVREPEIFYCDTDFNEGDDIEYYCPELGVSFKYESGFDYSI